MKLFAFQPKGHGEQSFYVMALNEKEARQCVDIKIKNMLADSDYWFTESSFAGWGSDYYKVTICEHGEVITNCND